MGVTRNKTDIEVPHSQNEIGNPEARVHAPSQGPLKTYFGFSLHMSADDFITKLLQQDGGFEFPETDLVTRLLRPGDVCIDAGSQVGYYSCLLAKCVGTSGRVYAFDANPAACQTTRRNADFNGFSNIEVIHAALGNDYGSTPFYVSTDDQSGLSSLGALPVYKEIISVPWLRLEDFLNERKLQRIRLLKIDVEGAEEITLRGLGVQLAAHRIDFVLLECFDERLRLLDTSTEKVAGLLSSAGYLAWEFGMASPNTWSRTDQMISRGDCNYLFGSPSSSDSVPVISMAGVIAAAQRKQPALKNQQEEFSKPGFSPAQALWSHREKLAAMQTRIQELYKAVDSPGEMSLYQWAQFTATVLEFQPDLIIELGRRAGNSTACFLEAAYQLGGGQCKVVSLCLDSTWRQFTSERLKKVVSKGWFLPGQIVEENILTFDFQAALAGSKRCLVFWDAHGFEVAECVLGALLPLLLPRQHLVLMHDLSDLRYSSPDPNYGTTGLWKGENAEQPALWLGWIFSRVAQSISILDFTTRNNIPLYSADESIHEELSSVPAKASALQALLGADMASMQSHWFWFTLNGAPQSLTFPSFSPQASLERFDRLATFDATLNSTGWQLLQRWRKGMNSLVPVGSKRRKAYNSVMRRLRRKSNS